jgi:K+-sensing histidine kinase KdpD
VLTISSSERRAQERQELAREVFCSNGLNADFDLIAGCDAQTAVARAARARNCSCVILERENDPPWRRWLRGSATSRLLGLANRLTLIAVPGEHVEDGPSASRCEQN